MKIKKVLALVLTACMVFSSPAIANATQINQTVETQEQTTEETQEQTTEETQEQTTEESWNGVVDVNEIQSKNRHENELKDSELSFSEETSGGVKAPENVCEEEKTGDASSEARSGEVSKTGYYSIEKVDNDTVKADLRKESVADSFYLNEETVSDEDMVRVIILMDDKSVIEQDNDAKIDRLTSKLIDKLEKKQKSVVSDIEKNVLAGKELEISYQYTWLLNGIATEVPYGLIPEIKEVDGVKDVLLQAVYETMQIKTNPYTVADSVMIGRDDLWADGYTGEGIKISIIDTGIDEDHQNFVALPDDKLTEDSATPDTVSGVLEQLNASKIYEGLTVDDVYRSTKIAYGFNYVDRNLVINHDKDTQGDHGTHVAGIAAANDLHNGEAVGVAPDAQLYVMKVFGKKGGAYSEDLLAAVEDSLILGADVINMSLGSPAGFTSDGGKFEEIYGRVNDTNTILAVAAGNSTTAGLGNLWGTNSNLTSNPDNSIVSSPATYVNATSVASVDNVGMKGYYIETDGAMYSYIDGSGSNDSLFSLAGNSYDYAMVPNFGMSIDDFLNAGVEGKIAVVQRGLTAFTQKHEFAQEAGAVACIVYNNVSGTISMDLSNGSAMIPCASITMKAGEFLASHKEENADAKIYISSEKAIVPSDTAYRMSDFSSWGISPDLKLEPDVTAPGGNIYSTLDKGQYGLMSGTSMASPNMAGVSALVMQYAKEQRKDLNPSQLHDFVNQLIVSTADPLSYDDELDYSPRNQGAGLVNAYRAVKTKAYLTVDGADVPKAELGDDVAKTGKYTYNFNVINFGDEDLYYSLNTGCQTEDVFYDDETEKYFMATTPVALAAETVETSENMFKTYDYNGDKSSDIRDARELFLGLKENEETYTDETFRYDMDGSEVIDKDDVQAYLDALVGKADSIDLTEETLKVEAGETAKVNVSVNVTEEGKNFMDTYFENGIYVEGFTKLTAKNVGGIDLSLPYLAFYGDWTQAPIFDSGYYWQSEEEMEASQYYNILFGNYGSKNSWCPGINPYIAEEFDIDNVSMSPNGDGYMDYMEDIYVSLLRNAASLSFTYTDKNTGEVYFEEDIVNASKSYYVSQYGTIAPYIYSWYSEKYNFTDANKETLPNNTELVLSIKATLDYDKHESNNLSDEWVTPITIDVEAPELVSAKSFKDEETGKYFMEVTVKDNVAVAAVNFLNKAGISILAQEPVDKAAHGEEVTMVYDITEFGEELVVVLGDYALNESTYRLKAAGNAPKVDKDLLYGYRVYDQNYYDDTLYGWIGIDKTTAETTVCSSEYYMDYALVAAANVGGMIVAQDANDDLVGIKPGYWDERTKIASLGTTLTQLAFDPSTETLYAVDKDNYCLSTIDIITGEMTRVTASGKYFSGVTAMAFTTDGVLYGINSSGNLCLIDKTTGMWGEQVLNVYSILKNYPKYAQSMTYDEETDSLYWARYTNSYAGVEGALYQIDLSNDYAFTRIDTISGNAEVVGLLSLNNNGYTLPEVSLESIFVDQTNVTLLVGGKQKVNAMKTPWFAEADGFIWTSEDEAVASVSESGVITANAPGTTNINVATADGKFKAGCEVKVVSPSSDLNGFVLIGDSLYNQWVSFNAENVSKFKTNTEQDFVTYYAGEYLDGNIYAYSSACELYRIDASTFERTKLSGARNDGYMTDMAYDYSTGNMYGIFLNSYYGTSQLVCIDTLTGDFDIINEDVLSEYSSPAITLAIATDGTMYMLTMDGILYTYDVETAFMNKLGYTGYPGSSLTQCMAYDHNTDELYWAMIGSVSALMYVDLETAKALPIGKIDGNCQAVALYAVPDEVPEREFVPVDSVEAKVESVKLLNGAINPVPVSVRPYNASDRTVLWESTDGNVAAVENGCLVAKNPGTTTITGTIGELSASFDVEVLTSTGAITGYVMADLSSGNGKFWGEFKDYDLSQGEGLAAADEYMLYAGEYFDGKIYGYGPYVADETYQYTFYVVDRESFEIDKAVTCKPDVADVVEMAFDYSTGTMYAVAGARNVSGNNALYMVDLDNGSLYKVANLDACIMTLACDEEGIMYGVSEEGILYQIDKATGKLKEIGETGYYANQYQAMAYDYDTGNMYWAQVYNDVLSWSVSAALLLVNVNDASTVNLGQIGLAGCQVSALHIVPEKNMEVQRPEITGLILDRKEEVLGVGDSFELLAKPTPVSASTQDIEILFSSSDDSVVTVEKDGKVTAVAAGKATVTASYEDISATCNIIVVGDDTVLYAVNENGWETSPLLKPNKISSDVSLPDEAELAITRACFSQDGYFYAVDKAGDLWKYTEDLVQVENIGNITSQIDNVDDIDFDVDKINIVDLEANAFNGKVYALIGFVSKWDEIYFVYEINVETAQASVVSQVSYDAGRPIDIAFMSENKIVYYDGIYDYIYTGDISEMHSGVEQLAFVQFTVASGKHISMTYSKELDRIFIATDDNYHYDGTLALFILNPNNGVIEMVGKARYDSDLTSIFLIEGATPAEGVAEETTEEETTEEETTEEETTEEETTEEETTEEETTEEETTEEETTEEDEETSNEETTDEGTSEDDNDVDADKADSDNSEADTDEETPDEANEAKKEDAIIVETESTSGEESSEEETEGASSEE